MGKGNERSALPAGGYNPKFADDLAVWIAENAELIEALLVLRDLGDEAAGAVDAVCALHRVRKMRFSVDLWEAMCEDDGDDPDELLTGRIPVEVLAMLRRAVWGSPWSDDEEAPALRIVDR